MDLNENTVRVLRQMWRGDNPSYSEIAKVLPELEKSGVKYQADVLEDKGLIKKKGKGRGQRRYVTEKGKDELLKYGFDKSNTATPQGLHEKSDSCSRGEEYFSHNFEVAFEIENRKMLKDDWFERVLEYEDIEGKFFPDFNQVKTTLKDWRFRLTEEEVLVRVKEEVRYGSSRGAKEKILERAREGAKYLEDKIEALKLSTDPSSMRVVTQHVGCRGGDNLVRGLGKYLDENDDDCRVENVRINSYEDHEELLAWFDKSGNEFHFESGNGGDPSGRRENAEDNQAFIEEISEFFFNEKDKTRSLLYQVPGKVNELEGVTEEVKTEQERQGSVLESLRVLVEEEVETRKTERKTRDAIIELVRSNQNVVQQNQDIIQRQEQMIEKQAEVIENLQSEVSDLRENMSLEERVRERYNESSDFSSVHEHSSGSNRSLYVWDLSDGWENRRYRKVLDEKARI